MAAGSKLLGQPLTAKQQVIWDMKRPVDQGGQGKINREIAAATGVSENYIGKAINTIHKKLGIAPRAALLEAALNRTVEVVSPEKAAAVVDAATDPEAKFKDIRLAMERAGMPGKLGDALLRRLRTKWLDVKEEVKALKTAEILDLLNKKIDLALRYMDDKVAAEASFRDLALGTAAMIEKRQLLRGEPTQIISDGERKKLHELLPALLDEARRRGVTVDGQVVGRSIEPA